MISSQSRLHSMTLSQKTKKPTSNFYFPDVIVLSYIYCLSANIAPVLEASHLPTVLPSPRMFSAPETCCWISSPFLVFSVLWWLIQLSYSGSNSSPSWLIQSDISVTLTFLLCLASNYVDLSWSSGSFLILWFVLSSLVSSLFALKPVSEKLFQWNCLHSFSVSALLS